MTDAELAASWCAAVRRREVRRVLDAIYTDTAAEINRRGPACWASGRCCHFERAGHRLYVTGLETAYCLANLGEHTSSAEPPNEPGSSPLSLPILNGGLRGRLQQASPLLFYPGCPFQQDNLCSVHAFKPLGCRVYFCDRSAQVWQQSLSETMLERVRSLHDRYAVEYRYGEWRAMLAVFTDDSRTRV